jgi:hypothetical protein
MTTQPIVFRRIVTDAKFQAARELGSLSNLTATLTPNEGGSRATLAVSWNADVTDEVQNIGFRIKDAQGHLWPQMSNGQLNVGISASGEAETEAAMPEGWEDFTVSVCLGLSDGGYTPAIPFAKV